MNFILSELSHFQSELSLQPTSQPERLQPPPLLQQTLPTQDPSEPQQQTHLQSDIQLSEFGLTNSVEHQHQAKPMWINNRRLCVLVLGFSLCAAVLGLIYYMHQTLKISSNNHEGTAMTLQIDSKFRISYLRLTSLLLFPIVTPCLSQACRRVSAHLSKSDDPFTQPCDYFLFTCGSDRFSPDSRGRQRGHGIPGHPQNKNEMVAWPEKRQQGTKGQDRGLTEEKLLNRKTVLLQHLREILGMSPRMSSKVQRFM